MNALLRIAAWILAITLVTLPVVAVLNGWIAGSRWPMRHLVVTGGAVGAGGRLSIRDCQEGRIVPRCGPTASRP